MSVSGSGASSGLSMWRCVVKKYALGSVLLQTLTFSLPVSAYQGSTHVFIFTAALNGRKSGRSLGTLLQINDLSESLEH